MPVFLVAERRGRGYILAMFLQRLIKCPQPRRILHPFLSIGVVLVLLGVKLNAEPPPLVGKLVRRDLNVATPVNLKEFGGPNISIQLLGNTPSAIDAVVVSPER
jgi:hypothetical protein